MLATVRILASCSTEMYSKTTVSRLTVFGNKRGTDRNRENDHHVLFMIS